MEVSVDTGSEGQSAPQGFTLGNRHHVVTEVLDRWPGSGYLYLKVRTGDGGIYLLHHDAATDRWQLWLYQADQPAPVEPLSGS